MKTANEIISAIDGTITSMLKRPLMFVDTPVSFEGTLLTLMGIYKYASTDENNSHRVADLWRLFTHELGYGNGALTLSSYLQKNNKLDDGWTRLTEAMSDFYNTKIKKID